MTAFETSCTYPMRWSASAFFFLQNIHQGGVPHIFKLVAFLLSSPCFKFSHLCSERSHLLQQRQLVRLAGKRTALGGKDVALQFNDLTLDGGSLLEAKEALRYICRRLERANSGSNRSTINHYATPDSVMLLKHIRD